MQKNLRTEVGTEVGAKEFDLGSRDVYTCGACSYEGPFCLGTPPPMPADNSDSSDSSGVGIGGATSGAGAGEDARRSAHPSGGSGPAPEIGYVRSGEGAGDPTVVPATVTLAADSTPSSDAAVAWDHSAQTLVPRSGMRVRETEVVTSVPTRAVIDTASTGQGDVSQFTGGFNTSSGFDLPDVFFQMGSVNLGASLRSIAIRGVVMIHNGSSIPHRFGKSEFAVTFKPGSTACHPLVEQTRHGRGMEVDVVVLEPNQGSFTYPRQQRLGFIVTPLQPDASTFARRATNYWWQLSVYNRAGASADFAKGSAEPTGELMDAAFLEQWRLVLPEAIGGEIGQFSDFGTRGALRVEASGINLRQHLSVLLAQGTALTLGAEPTLPAHAATKAYVDAISDASAGVKFPAVDGGAAAWSAADGQLVTNRGLTLGPSFAQLSVPLKTNSRAEDHVMRFSTSRWWGANQLAGSRIFSMGVLRAGGPLAALRVSGTVWATNNFDALRYASTAFELVVRTSSLQPNVFYSLHESVRQTRGFDVRIVAYQENGVVPARIRVGFAVDVPLSTLTLRAFGWDVQVADGGSGAGNVAWQNDAHTGSVASSMQTDGCTLLSPLAPNASGANIDNATASEATTILENALAITTRRHATTRAILGRDIRLVPGCTMDVTPDFSDAYARARRNCVQVFTRALSTDQPADERICGGWFVRLSRLRALGAGEADRLLIVTSARAVVKTARIVTEAAAQRITTTLDVVGVSDTLTSMVAFSTPAGKVLWAAIRVLGYDVIAGVAVCDWLNSAWTPAAEDLADIEGFGLLDASPSGPSGGAADALTTGMPVICVGSTLGLDEFSFTQGYVREAMGTAGSFTPEVPASLAPTFVVACNTAVGNAGSPVLMPGMGLLVGGMIITPPDQQPLVAGAADAATIFRPLVPTLQSHRTADIGIAVHPLVLRTLLRRCYDGFLLSNSTPGFEHVPRFLNVHFFRSPSMPNFNGAADMHAFVRVTPAVFARRDMRGTYVVYLPSRYIPPERPDQNPGVVLRHTGEPSDLTNEMWWIVRQVEIMNASATAVKATYTLGFEAPHVSLSFLYWLAESTDRLRLTMSNILSATSAQVVVETVVTAPMPSILRR